MDSHKTQTYKGYRLLDGFTYRDQETVSPALTGHGLATSAVPVHPVPRVVVDCRACKRAVWDTTTKCPHCGVLGPAVPRQEEPAYAQ